MLVTWVLAHASRVAFLALDASGATLQASRDRDEAPAIVPGELPPLFGPHGYL
jgi:hypothetical protein